MATLAQRRRERLDAAQARRKKIFVIIGICALLVLLAIQLPKTLDLLSSETADVAPALIPATTPVPTKPASPQRELKVLLKSSGSDPFQRRSVGTSDPRPFAVAGPAGARDPFRPATMTEVIAPKRIIIGTPTPGRTPTVGYIVVLASIRTGAGRSVAERIATNARKDGLGEVGVLDSSTRRPLRAGYYVAYAGPYSSGAAVRDAAARAHALGYRTAYIRELVRY
jgi:hypothetical protein